MTVPRDVLRVAEKLYRQLDTPRSLTCYILLQAGEWDQLVTLTVNPHDYEPFLPRKGVRPGLERLRADLQATEFLRKCEGLPTTFDLEAKALEGFHSCEEQCRKSNARLNIHLEYPVFTTALQWRADDIFRRAREWLKTTLGSLPAFLDGRFGPGVTFESKRWKRRRLTAYDKLSNPPSITPSARILEDHCLWQTAFRYGWANAIQDRWIPTAPGNRFETVPKDATKKRGICIEPGANLIMQLGIGRALRKALKRVGINLEEGQDLHQTLARLASVLLDSVTIDLSNASDTVCRLLVKLLLPSDWYDVLDAIRSHYTFIGGRWVPLEKFSSMGNGFTFELETLLFCALLHGVGCKVGEDTFVYGDDIICPSEKSADALAILQYSGFTPNARKTFTQGYFRESCGGDFYLGQAVRPYYLKEIPCDAADWISVANGLWRSSKRLELRGIMAARNNALDNVPSDIRRCRGPEALGDLVVTDDDATTWQSAVRSSIRYLRVWRPVLTRNDLYYRRRVKDARFGPPQRGRYVWITTRRSKRYKPGVDHAAALLGLPSDGLAPRNAVEGYRFGRIAWS